MILHLSVSSSTVRPAIALALAQTALFCACDKTGEVPGSEVQAEAVADAGARPASPAQPEDPMALALAKFHGSWSKESTEEGAGAKTVTIASLDQTVREWRLVDPIKTTALSIPPAISAIKEAETKKEYGVAASHMATVIGGADQLRTHFDAQQQKDFDDLMAAIDAGNYSVKMDQQRGLKLGAYSMLYGMTEAKEISHSKVYFEHGDKASRQVLAEVMIDILEKEEKRLAENKRASAKKKGRKGKRGKKKKDTLTPSKQKKEEKPSFLHRDMYENLSKDKALAELPDLKSRFDALVIYKQEAE